MVCHKEFNFISSIHEKLPELRQKKIALQVVLHYFRTNIVWFKVMLFSLELEDLEFQSN